MQNVEVVEPTDTNKMLSSGTIAVELVVFTSYTQSEETKWFDVKEADKI